MSCDEQLYAYTLYFKAEPTRSGVIEPLQVWASERQLDPVEMERGAIVGCAFGLTVGPISSAQAAELRARFSPEQECLMPILM